MSDTKKAPGALATTEQLDDATRPYLGRWNRLVSTTNWEKGKIICQWRTALQAAGAPAGEYSDEAWSRRVGYVSSQHVGRLRRVYDRFGSEQDDYQGLYWSHFHAALDWNDAEMWLEGAVQNAWSISQMRLQRWQALGAPAKLKPRDEDIITAELDEDVSPELDASAPAAIAGSIGTVRDPGGEEAFGPDFGDEQSEPVGSQQPDDDPIADQRAQSTPQRLRPFAELAELPPDLAEAFEAFKLAILRHKVAAWQEVARDDVLATLDALKELALAP